MLQAPIGSLQRCLPFEPFDWVSNTNYQASMRVVLGKAHQDVFVQLKRTFKASRNVRVVRQLVKCFDQMCFVGAQIRTSLMGEHGYFVVLFQPIHEEGSGTFGFSGDKECQSVSLIIQVRTRFFNGYLLLVTHPKIAKSRSPLTLPVIFFRL